MHVADLAGKELLIRDCCQRILASSGFRDSPRISSFLRYIVDLTLEGREADIKEYAIGVDVFKRGADFDPKTDPIVRVQAGRLRMKLTEYYGSQKSTDPLQIEVPKGSYVPVFHLNNTETSSGLVADAPRHSVNGASPFPNSLPQPHPRRRFVVTPWRMGLLSILLSTLVFLGWRSRQSEGPQAPRQLRRLTHDWATMPALSWDGKLLAYVSDRAGNTGFDIWMQPVSGGDPVRLTELPEDELSPAFSPDDTTVAFGYGVIRPGSPNQGLYTVSVFDHNPRRLVAGFATNPSFSPDGNWITYTGGTINRREVHVLPAGGGSPKRLAQGLLQAGFPTWSPDGKNIIFLGTEAGASSLLSRKDWWVVPAEGGTPLRTHAIEALLRQGVIKEGEVNGDFWPSAWFRDRIVFRAGRGDDSIHVWTIRLNPKTFAAEGDARQVTFGGARETLPAVSKDGSLVFCGQTINREFWGATLETNSGTSASSELRQLTANTASDGTGTVTRNGKSILFNAVRSGNSDIRRIELDSRLDKPVLATPAQEHLLGISGDGSILLYWALEGRQRVVHAGSAEENVFQRVCSDCSAQLSPDGSRVFYTQLDHNQGEREVFMLDLRSKTRKAPFKASREICFPCSSSRFSWDGRWVASIRSNKSAPSDIVVQQLADDHDLNTQVLASIGGEGDGFAYWSAASSLLDWSPDGNLLYFASDRDRYRCIWAQRLHPVTKSAIGKPFAVLHNHERTSHYLSSMTATRDRLVLGLSRGSSDIWMTKLD